MELKTAAVSALDKIVKSISLLETTKIFMGYLLLPQI